MIEGGLEYSGYIDIKQPPKIKGRKLKTWKKKWVVMHEMSIRSAGRSAAKVDIYADEKTATESPADKMTFILEFVTDIRQAKSKNRLHAFEVVEKEAVLLLAGATELETQTWVSKFRKIFFPHKEEIDNFSVVIVFNEHSGRLGLQGIYTMTVNPEVVAISSKQHNSYEWSLNMLKRFHLEKDAENPTKELLTIECGPKSECGEATFQFRSDHVTKILDSIKKNIYIALDRKRTERSKTNTPVTEKRVRSSNEETRTRSETMCSIENRYKELLENATNNQEKAGQIPYESQESRESQAESVVSDDAPELPPKKRQNVTFDVSTPDARDAAKIDLLASPNVVSTEEESTYNRVDFHQPKSAPKTGNIISMVTVAKPGYETKLLLDDRGYSHVDIQNSKPVISEDKTRSLSNMSSHSSISCRSASVGSKDSGIIYAKVDKSVKSENGTQSKRSSNSFDSAVSTSSAVGSITPSHVDSNTTTLTVEVQAVEVTGAELIENQKHEHGMQETNDNGIYQDMSLEDNKSISKSELGGDKLHAKLKLRKSNSAGTFTKDEKENEYEDLDNFRKGKKNLVKHLGMDPQVDPKSVPPSLPERPSSHKIKRKFHNNEKKLFTLPFRSKNRKQKERAVSISSSSSDSDSESTRGSKKSDDLAVKVWPLGNKSVIAENEDLYQPIAIERYLNDNDGVTLSQKRERSSSLNLNMVSAMKRPSITSATLERSNQVWKHNRNVSMQMDMLNRRNDPNNTMLNVERENFDFSFQPGMLIRENDRTSVEMNSDDERNNDSLEIKSDDEPIYAEVEPVKKSSSRIENPFPNLTIWKPQDMSDVAEVSELNETKYENDDSMNSSNPREKLELLNQGFVIDDEPKCGSESLLIDLSEPINAPSTQSGIDIFNMGVGPSFLDTSLLIPTRSQIGATNVSANLIDIFSLGCGTPLPPSSSDLFNSSSRPHMTVSSYNGPHNVTSQTSKPGAESESIYMDMESCNNESIYVLPSSINLKN